MSITAKTFTPKWAIHPTVRSWMLAGGNASPKTLAKMSRFFHSIPASMIYNAAADTGLVRLNLMAGNALADCLRPQIIVHGDATDSSTGFAESAFNPNPGFASGLTGDGTNYLVTGMTITQFISNPLGGFGAWISPIYILPGNQYYMGATLGGSNTRLAMRHVTITTYRVQFYYGATGTAEDVNLSGNGTFWKSGLSAGWRNSATNIRTYLNKRTEDTADSTSAVQSDFQFYIMGLNDNGVASGITTSILTMGGYFYCKGNPSEGDKNTFIDAWITFARSMGRGGTTYNFA